MINVGVWSPVEIDRHSLAHRIILVLSLPPQLYLEITTRCTWNRRQLHSRALGNRSGPPPPACNRHSTLFCFVVGSDKPAAGGAWNAHSVALQYYFRHDLSRSCVRNAQAHFASKCCAFCAMPHVQCAITLPPRYLGQTLQFKAPVFLDDTVTARCEVQQCTQTLLMK